MCDSNSIKTVLPIILIDRLLTYILYKLVSIRTRYEMIEYEEI